MNKVRVTKYLIFKVKEYGSLPYFEIIGQDITNDQQILNFVIPLKVKILTEFINYEQAFLNLTNKISNPEVKGKFAIRFNNIARKIVDANIEKKNDRILVYFANDIDNIIKELKEVLLNLQKADLHPNIDCILRHVIANSDIFDISRISLCILNGLANLNWEVNCALDVVEKDQINLLLQLATNHE